MGHPFYVPVHDDEAVMDGAPVIFQYVVRLFSLEIARRRRGGAKVEIGRIDFQGKVLPCRLLSPPSSPCGFLRGLSEWNNVLTIYRHPRVGTAMIKML
jgi:hypothetical protein